MLIFLSYGIYGLQWDAEIPKYIALIATCLSTQFIVNKILHLPHHNLKSALITSLGLSILLKTPYWYVACLAGFLAILGKLIFRQNGKHFVNPANFGLVATVLLTHQAWVSPGQWGSQATLFFLVGSLGFIVCSRAKSLGLALAFGLTYFVLQYARTILYLGWPHDFLWQQFTSGSLLLFTFFMITDPISTPNNAWAGRLWASAIAVVAFYLANFKFVNASPVWVLFFAQFATPFINYFSVKIGHYFSKNKPQNFKQFSLSFK